MSRWVISEQIRSCWSYQVTLGQLGSHQVKSRYVMSKLSHIRSSGHVGSQQIMSRSIQGQVNSRSRTSQSGQFCPIEEGLGQVGSFQGTSGQHGSPWINWSHPSKQCRLADVSPTSVQHVELTLDWHWTGIHWPRLFIGLSGQIGQAGSTEVTSAQIGPQWVKLAHVGSCFVRTGMLEWWVT